MTKRMLIDAMHAEETRVAVVDGTYLEELDVETAQKEQIKGNIYLAKVIRTEPSLQAAFVEYGGNRHGFLAFSEIHPDYYQIPVADKEKLKELMEAEQKARREKETEHNDDVPYIKKGKGSYVAAINEITTEKTQDIAKNPSNIENNEIDASVTAIEDANITSHDELAQNLDIVLATPDETNDVTVACAYTPASESELIEPVDFNQTSEEIEEIENHDDEDIDDEIKKPHFLKNYKIQEVIKKGQILLIQVLKEEKGNKGAALTTYLSLAGRYCVLMPNTAHGGGVSRKITNISERRELKQILSELKIPENMGVIVRTAGKDKNKQEIKRDYDYLIKTWMNIREKTLKAQAPALIHEEGNLVKRALRDLYTKEIGEIIIAGEKEFKYAKEFMKMLLPAVAKKITLYKNTKLPLFNRYQVESQIAMIHNPIIQLKSGGYLVINQTEALVAIDINSGRATKERTIEETALKTNLEAADEIARQLRLRDLSGLVVIDFIDMDEAKNNNAVERRMKEALKKDKARVQVGKISGFGLMEMSRQRLHSSFLEASYNPCPCCNGTGLIRSIPSCALSITRVIEEEVHKNQLSQITLTVHPEVALYILNHKRNIIINLETNYNVSILIMGDDNITQRMDYRIEKVKGKKVEEKPTLIEEIIEIEVEDKVENIEEINPEIETDNQDEQATQNKKKRGRNNRNFYKKRGKYNNKKKGDASINNPVSVAPSSNDATGEKKRGWWQRLIK